MKTEWVHKKLGDCCERLRNGMTYDIEETQGYMVTRIETISDGFIDYSKVGYTSVLPCDDYKLIKGDILFSHINSVKHIGKVAYFDDTELLFHGMNLLLIRANKVIDNKYLFYILSSDKYRRKIRTLAKTAVNQASISTTDLGKFEISYPASLSAQRRIAAILTSADKVIAATQKTIAKYKQIKQGMMEELFNEQCTMNNVQWRKVRLGEVGEIVTGSTPTTTKAEYWDGEYNFYSPADFDDRVYCGKTERTVTKAGMDTGRRIPENSIMVACIASIGKLSINRTEGITNQQINTIVPKTGYDYIFLYYLLLFNVEKIKGGAAQTTIPIINKEDFSNLEFSVPDFSEQKRMASILNGIDSKIEVEQRVLNKYIQVKKGLMGRLLNKK